MLCLTLPNVDMDDPKDPRTHLERRTLAGHARTASWLNLEMSLTEVSQHDLPMAWSCRLGALTHSSQIHPLQHCLHADRRPQILHRH